MDDKLNKENQGEKTVQTNTRPGFLTATDKQKKQEAAAQSLKNIDKSAESDDLPSGKQSGMASALNAENKTGLYKGNGKAALAKKATKGKFSLKKGGAGLAAAITILIIGGVAAFIQLFQPFDLIAQFKETFNSMHVSVNKRSDRFFRAQMETGRTKNPIKGSKLFGQDFKISDNQKAKLALQGIEYDDETFKDSNGKAIKVLKYKNDSGGMKVVGADDKAVKALNSLDLSKYSTGVDGVKFDAEAISFKNAYATNTKFFQGYNAGSMTWRGQVGNWFGKNTSKFLSNNKLSRNKFQDWKNKLAKEGKDADAKELMKKTIAEGSEKIDGGGIKNTDKNDGNPESKEESFESKEESFESLDRKDLNEDVIKTRLNAISGKFNKAANAGCAIIGAIGAINLLVQASEMLQILNLASSYFEIVDKTEYGLGDDAPINELASSLNEKKENTHEVIKGKATGKIVDGKIEGLYTEPEITKKTAMESEGIASLYSNTRANPKDSSVMSFNVMASSKKILGGLGEGTTSFKGCLVAQAGAAAVSAGVDTVAVLECVVGVIGSAVTYGTSLAACGPLAADIIISIASGIALATVLGALVSFVTPMVVNMLTRDLISELGGEDLGNALTFGANVYQSGAHRANGGALSTVEKYPEFAVAQSQVVAENAKYERESLSPFDITSSNTFMGSTLKQLASFAGADSLMSVVIASEASISSAVVSALPLVSAANIVETLPTIEEYEDVNPYLSSIGAIGDSYGNPYVTTDMSTIDLDPADVIDKIGKDNFEDEDSSDGNVVIKDDSNLAKYVKYCSNRSSPFGVADQNIAADFDDSDVETENSTFNNTANGAIGSVPVVGDVLEIIKDANQLANIGWISGESCVAGNTVNAGSSPDWEEAKYYQRFIEDQSLAESMGIIEQSAVATYLDKYYEENPLDNSYEGMLARYSGMTKDNVVALLDVIEYYDFIANYDASDRYAFGGSVMEEAETIKFDNENVLAGEFILQNQIVYADVRNRVFTV